MPLQQSSPRGGRRGGAVIGTVDVARAAGKAWGAARAAARQPLQERSVGGAAAPRGGKAPAVGIARHAAAVGVENAGGLREALEASLAITRSLAVAATPIGIPRFSPSTDTVRVGHA